jgi:hypothetical protein
MTIPKHIFIPEIKKGTISIEKFQFPVRQEKLTNSTNSNLSRSNSSNTLETEPETFSKNTETVSPLKPQDLTFFNDGVQHFYFPENLQKQYQEIQGIAKKLQKVKTIQEALTPINLLEIDQHTIIEDWKITPKELKAIKKFSRESVEFFQEQLQKSHPEHKVTVSSTLFPIGSVRAASTYHKDNAENIPRISIVCPLTEGGTEIIPIRFKGKITNGHQKSLNKETILYPNNDIEDTYKVHALPYTPIGFYRGNLVKSEDNEILQDTDNDSLYDMSVIHRAPNEKSVEEKRVVFAAIFNLEAKQ